MGRQKRRQQERRAQQQGRQNARTRAQTPRQRQAAARRSQARGLGFGAIAAGVGVIVLVVAGIAYAATHQTNTTATPTPSQQSLAPVVDGVKCQVSEQLVYHIHQYLELYDHGKRISVPSSIGIPGTEQNPTCFYWIHVHALYPDILHVESPLQKTFHLGNFFNIWKATKNDAIPAGDAFVTKLEAAAARGQVTAFYNGKRWNGSYRSIPLTSHAVIAVEIGKPVVPPQPYTSWNGL